MIGILMLAHVKQWLTAPVFVNEDKKRLTVFLNTLLAAILSLSSLILFFLFVFAYPAHQVLIQLIIGVMALAIVARILLRWWPVRAVSWMLLTGAWGLALVTVIQQRNVVTAPLYSFFAITALAPFVVGRGAGIWFAVLSAFAVVILVPVAKYAEWPPQRGPYMPLLIWSFFSATLVFVAVILELIAHNLKESLAEARRTGERLQFANEFHRLLTDLALDFINVMPDQVDTEMRRLLQRLAEFVQADICLIMGLSDDRRTGTCLHEWHRAAVTLQLDLLQQVSVMSYPWLMHQLNDLKDVCIASLDELPFEAIAERQLLEELGLHGSMMVPLLRRRELVGFVGYGMVDEICECRPESMALLRVAGEVIVNALDRKRSGRQRLEIALERERVETLQLFISNISHDLKTPLTVIKSNLYLAQRKEDGPQRDRHLINIEAQVDRVDHLLQDLLTLLHLDSSPEFDFQSLDVREVLGDIENQLRPLAEEKQLVLTVQSAPFLGEVLADRRQLARVFTNLVQNAISYTPPGETITIQVYPQADNVIIEVTDTGMGISSADLPRIFDQFYRAPAAKAVSSNGTGLGLSIVARIIQMHGGAITVDSIEAEGSTFRVRLPVVSLKL